MILPFCWLRLNILQSMRSDTVVSGRSRFIARPHPRLPSRTAWRQIKPNRGAREHRKALPPPRALPSSPACQTVRERQQQCCSKSFKLHEARSLCSLGSSRHVLTLVLGGGQQGSWQMAENLSAGVRVRLHSLQAAAQHNGVDGHLLKWNASTGRWGVKLSTGQELSVRPANVMPTCSHAGCGQRIGASEAAGAGLRTCAKCRQVRYCSRACQKAA